MLNGHRPFLAALALAGALGCKGAKTDQPVVTTANGGSAESPSGQQAAGAGKSLVRLVNAIPSRQSIDVSGADRTVFSAIPYKGVTPYAELRENMVTFRLRVAGGDSAVADNSQAMSDGYRYTIVALPGSKGEPSMRILRDEVVPDSGKARIRVINAAPDIGNVDVAMQGQKDPLFGGVHYGTEAGYMDIAPTSGALEIRSDLKTKKPLLLKSMNFAAGKAYTIVLAGSARGGIDAITFDDTETGGVLSLGQ